MKKTKRTCFDVHDESEVPCDLKDCRQWINHEGDLNCAIICANRNGPLTLHETAERLGVSFVRVKQNQDTAMKRLSKILKKDFNLLFNKD
jgi:hypothetical protein